MTTKSVYKTTQGLITDFDRFTFEYGGGQNTPLSSSSNVDVTDNLKIRRRGGKQLCMAASIGNITSIFPTASKLYFVEHDALSVASTGFEVIRLRNVTPAVPMSFFSDMYGRVFYSNGHENGFVLDDVAYNWVLNAVPKVGPKSTRGFTVPPVGHLIASLGSRAVVAHGNYLFFSEPFDAFNFNLGDTYIPIDSPATMFREVTGGFWVSTSTQILFFSGRNPKEADPIKRYSKPVVRGTDVAIQASDMFDEVTNPGVIVTARDGILFLSDDGLLVPLSNKKIDLPPGLSGTAMVYEGKYITKINTL